MPIDQGSQMNQVQEAGECTQALTKAERACNMGQQPSLFTPYFLMYYLAVF